ncbi:MAG: DUF4270 family protein [Flavobacteriales bacterium]|nr:DUF4270 family protein [Flavobacteriales bacterium]
MKQPILLLWLSAITLFSCTDPQIIGLEIQPEGDKITISSTSNNSPFTALTKKVDSVRSTKTLFALLGNYESASLLDAKASFSTHLRLSDNAVDFGANPVLDSAIMTLAYAGYYGDTTIEMNIQVEQLTEEISDTTYFSDDIFTTSPFSSPLEYSFLPTPNTLRFRDVDTVGLKSLSFNANQIGQLILDAPTDKLVDNDVFVPYFKGLHFSVPSAQPSSSILYFNLIDGGSKLTIYYNDSLSYDLLFSAAATRVNHFEMQDDLDLQNKLAVQSMAGLEVHLDFNDLQSLKESLSDKVINQALISFTEQNATDLPHSSLSLVRLDTNGTRYFLEDILEGQSHFGGELTDNTYSFNITKFLQNLVQDEYEANTLILVPTGESVNANRTEINQNIELNIIYTEF